MAEANLQIRKDKIPGPSAGKASVEGGVKAPRSAEDTPDEKADDQAHEKAGGDGQGSSATTLLDGRYKINLDRPLVWLSSPCADAYSVTDIKDHAASFYALIMRPGTTHRDDVLDALLKAPTTSLLNPVRKQIMRPVPKGPERLVIMVQAPTGPSLSEVAAKNVISGHHLRKYVIPSLIQALSALHARGIPHRAIRPDNIFFTSSGLEDVVLGDCFSAPPAAAQPTHFEPLERSSADSLGRGEGSLHCDLYALGATLLSSHIGRLPDAVKDQDKMFAARMGQGSFWAHAAGVEVPGVIGNLLRGLLNDDQEERWTLKEVRAWAESTMPNRRSVNVLWTFARPVTFRRISYSDRRLLARDFARNPLDAAIFLRQIDFVSWAQNMITTELFSEKFEKLIDVRREGDLSSGRHGDHALVARACAYLDPMGPLRYRGMSVCLDGIGPAMVDAFHAEDETRQAIVSHIFDNNVLPAIVEITLDRNPAANALQIELRQAVDMMRRNKGRMGLLCILYKMNPSLQCLSPRLKDYWITSPRRLLMVLDHVAKNSSELSPLLDEHVLAYFCAHTEQAERYVRRLDISRRDPVQLMAAVADLLAFLQSKLKAGLLVNLSEHLVKSLKPLANTLKSRTRRRMVVERLDELAKTGDLGRLTAIIDLAHLKMVDYRGFSEAKNKVFHLEQAMKRLRRGVKPSDKGARLAGFRAASALGWLVVLITITILSLQAQ